MIGVISVAFFAKFLGCSLAARLNGLVWRESFSIGALMSCKGLVELIVLNIGLQAKILSTRTFTIFVVMALVTTFATTPLTRALYPPWYQRKLEAWKRGEIDWDSGEPLLDGSGDEPDAVTQQKMESSRIKSLMVYLRLDNMPTTLAFVSLLGGKSTQSESKLHPTRSMGEKDVQPTQDSKAEERRKRVQVHGLRLIELTERGSAVMRVAEVDEYSAFDPVLNTFRVLGQLYNLAVSGEAAIIPQSSYADTLVNRAAEESSDLLILPWSETGSMGEAQTITKDSTRNKLASDSYSSFVSQALDTARSNTAIFINKNFSGTLKQRPLALTRKMSVMSVNSTHREHLTTVPTTDRSHHIFMPYFGGADGRVALRLLLQLAENPEITATIVYYPNIASDADVQGTVVPKAEVPTSPTNLQRVFSNEDDAAFFVTMQRSIDSDIESRVLFETASATSSPAQDALARAQSEVGQNPKNGGDIIIIGRNIQFARPDGSSSCFGVAANIIIDSNIRASFLVVQAKGSGASA